MLVWHVWVKPAMLMYPDKGAPGLKDRSWPVEVPEVEPARTELLPDDRIRACEVIVNSIPEALCDKSSRMSRLGLHIDGLHLRSEPLMRQHLLG